MGFHFRSSSAILIYFLLFLATSSAKSRAQPSSKKEGKGRKRKLTTEETDQGFAGTYFIYIIFVKSQLDSANRLSVNDFHNLNYTV